MLIHLENVSKTFKVAERGSTIKEVLKSFIRRKYKEVHAISDISFDIKEGEIVRLHRAKRCREVHYNKNNVWYTYNNITVNALLMARFLIRSEQVTFKILALYFGQRSQLWWDVPPDDSFYLLRDIYKIPKDKFESTRSMLIKALDLSQVIKIPTRQLSLGQRMRCEIAAALLHRPKILFLDEPTIGLDAVSKLQVRDFIKKINKEWGTTIILTTHDMQDIEALTSRIILIGKGKKLFDGNLEDIKEKYQNKDEKSTDEIIAKMYKQLKLVS